MGALFGLWTVSNNQYDASWTRPLTGLGGLFLGFCGLDAKLALHSGLLADVRAGGHDCCLARSLFIRLAHAIDA